VLVRRPPMTTVASGRWTSAPDPADRAMGTNPRLAASAVVTTGRSPTSAGLTLPQGAGPLFRRWNMGS
jgi:hypothetical protein